MKSSLIFPAVTALIGFSIAWIIKPGDPPQASVPPSAKHAGDTPNPPKPDSRAAGDQKTRTSKAVLASDFPLADRAEQSPQTRNEGKLLRLTEALGLSTEQQGEIISLIEKVQAINNGNMPVIEDLALRGAEVEAGLAKLLNPEQLAKFEELRLRERENRIEVRAQAILTPVIKDIDLAANQREQVLERLREKAKRELEIIPPAATLLLDQSMLPTNGKELAIEGVLLSAKFGQTNTNLDPNIAYQEVMTQRKSELEVLIRCFDGILTPGQMGQYYASIAEKNKIMEKAQDFMRANPKK